MGDHKKKLSPADQISRETKILQGNTWEKIPSLKKISLMLYNAAKNHTPLYVGKKSSLKVWGKNLTQTKPIPPLKSQMVGFKRTSSKSLVSIFILLDIYIFFSYPV